MDRKELINVLHRFEELGLELGLRLKESKELLQLSTVTIRNGVILGVNWYVGNMMIPVDEIIDIEGVKIDACYDDDGMGVMDVNVVEIWHKCKNCYGTIIFEKYIDD